MASSIDSSGIDSTFPTPGLDNDSKGFRDNFAAIKLNFDQAATEITNLDSALASFTGSVAASFAYVGSSQGSGNGYTGSAGPGYTGSAGAAGSPGGFAGSRGPEGYTGSFGLGYTGSVGAGYTGSAGAQGPAGSPGGYTGSSGTVGYVGSTGPGGGQPGADAITLFVTNESVTLFAYADGTIPDFTAAVGQLYVYEGINDVTASATLSVSASVDCTGTVNTSTNTPVNLQPKGYYRITAMPSAAEIGTLTLQAVYNTVTLTKVITVTKSIVGYEIVGTLPSTNLFDGRIVYLNTDGKLYRYVGTPGSGGAWTTAVPAVDITGTLQAAQIAAVDATTITGQIVATQITDGAISSPKISAGAVIAGKIATGAIQAGDIASGAITAGKIAANAITATEIASNAVTADKILAGAVTAAKVSVTSLSALSANVGTLTAGTIQNTGGTFRVDVSNGRTITQTGSYMKVTGAPFGSTSQFIEWYGPYSADLTTCTEGTAIYYLKTNGSAYFGGSLLAGVLKNSVQSTILTSANTAILGPFSSNGNQITITASFLYRGYNTFPGTSGGVSAYNNVTKANPTFTIVLYRDVGSGYSAVSTINVTGTWNGEAPNVVDVSPGSYEENAAISTTFVDPTLSTVNRTYKLAFTSWNKNTTVITNTLSVQSVEQ